jgi:arsenite-transporting ATPase
MNPDRMVVREAMRTYTYLNLYGPAAILHHDVSQELTSNNGSATLRVAMPFVEKADIDLKKIGLDVVVRVGGQKRTIILPATMAAYRPRSAKFEDGALSVSFEKEEDGAAAAATE